MWSHVFLLPLFLHVGAFLKTDCPQPCIPIDKCPALVILIRTNPRTVREATCKVDGVPLPLVCCPPSTASVNESVTPRTITGPQPPSHNALLPRKCGQFASGDRIFGGEVTQLGSFPWMAALGYWNNQTKEVDFKCGGSVINERYILTAAHCFRNPLHVIRLAEWDLSTEIDCQTTLTGFETCADGKAQDFQHEKIIKHPDYRDHNPFPNDIALIRVSRPITFSRWIQPVCLPDRNFDVPATLGRRQGIVTGWGFTELGTTSNVLLRVSLPLVDTADCNSTYVEHGSKLVGKQLCFGGVLGKDSCKGDSGGPIVMTESAAPPYIQIGVVSFGPPCGITAIPAVYANVASYRDWIDENMEP